MTRFRRFDTTFARAESLEAVRARRAGMHGTIVGLERALAAPAPGRPDAWADAVGEALAAARDEVADHVGATEAPGGFLGQVLTDAPRLANHIHQLRVEHGEILDLVAAATQHLDRGPAAGVDPDRWVADTREMLLGLLGLLVRHRQAGADLVYDAYQTDLGGES